jgi:hypothetical protein
MDALRRSSSRSAHSARRESPGSSTGSCSNRCIDVSSRRLPDTGLACRCEIPSIDSLLAAFAHGHDRTALPQLVRAGRSGADNYRGRGDRAISTVGATGRLAAGAPAAAATATAFDIHRLVFLVVPGWPGQCWRRACREAMAAIPRATKPSPQRKPRRAGQGRPAPQPRTRRPVPGR